MIAEDTEKEWKKFEEMKAKYVGFFFLLNSVECVG
jgi:hypothetical protein